MNRIFQPTADCVLFRTSNAAEHYKGKAGRFKVVYQRNAKTFSSLVEAFMFYMTLDDEATLLEVSTDSTIIESKIKLFLN